MTHSVIVGVDVSKKSLDLFCKPADSGLKITNDEPGYRQWFGTLKEGVASLQEVLVVMEHTGKYSLRFEAFLQDQGLAYCKIPALEIKRAQGMSRGKNDRIDAERIADYGWLRREKLAPDRYPDKTTQVLETLISLRKKLVSDRAGYLSSRKEIQAVGQALPVEINIHQTIIEAFTDQITQLDKQIKTLVQASPKLAASVALLTSIKGIGLIVALHMITCTGNFTRFTDARKFNCYAGIAPFEHSSGSSLRNKPRVSHLANKKIKTLINMAAFSAIRTNPELKEYYCRRVNEGKSKMLCVNIVRAKLVARMFAVIKRQTPYQPASNAA